MSDQQAKSQAAESTAQAREAARLKRALQAKIWMSLSFFISACILGWAFSLPFRNNGPLAKQDPRMEPGATRPVISPQSSAEEYLATAIAMDQEFMRKRAAKAQAEETRIQNLPGKEEAKIRWNKHVVNVKKQMAALANAPPGSLEWEYRRELQASLEDGPL